MGALPPGTILQLMYLKERLIKRSPGHFVEIGPGRGEMSALLLTLGWTGTIYELEATTVAHLNVRFSKEIIERRLSVVNEDWLVNASTNCCNLILTCMVMEHLDAAQEQKFLERAKLALRPDGIIISLVPGAPELWGIEDEIAGHFRRYTREYLKKLMNESGWEITHLAGLTYPVSNVLLPISNWLVRRSEKSKLNLSLIERTKLSGMRDVSMKTKYPSLFRLFLNAYFMYPLHWLQKIFKDTGKSMVLYCEANRKARGTGSI